MVIWDQYGSDYPGIGHFPTVWTRFPRPCKSRKTCNYVYNYEELGPETGTCENRVKSRMLYCAYLERNIKKHAKNMCFHAKKTHNFRLKGLRKGFNLSYSGARNSSSSPRYSHFRIHPMLPAQIGWYHGVYPNTYMPPVLINA